MLLEHHSASGSPDSSRQSQLSIKGLLAADWLWGGLVQGQAEADGCVTTCGFSLGLCALMFWTSFPGSRLCRKWTPAVPPRPPSSPAWSLSSCPGLHNLYFHTGPRLGRLSLSLPPHSALLPVDDPGECQTSPAGWNSSPCPGGLVQADGNS